MPSFASWAQALQGSAAAPTQQTAAQALAVTAFENFQALIRRDRVPSAVGSYSAILQDLGGNTTGYIGGMGRSEMNWLHSNVDGFTAWWNAINSAAPSATKATHTIPIDPVLVMEKPATRRFHDWCDNCDSSSYTSAGDTLYLSPNDGKYRCGYHNGKHTRDWADTSGSHFRNYSYTRPASMMRKLGGPSGPFFGLELECYLVLKAPARYWTHQLAEIMGQLNPTPMEWVAKSDGSLQRPSSDQQVGGEYGIELDSLPMSRAYLQQHFTTLHTMATDGLLKGFKGYNNGLHINCDNTLSKLQQQRLIRLMNHRTNKWTRLLEFIGQRSLSDYCYQAQENRLVSRKFIPLTLTAHGRYDDTAEAIRDMETRAQEAKTALEAAARQGKAVDFSDGGAYIPSSLLKMPEKHGIVYMDTHRIEFRMFKANLLPERLNHALDFCESMLAYCTVASVPTPQGYLAYVSANYSHYPYLVRRILSIVNSPAFSDSHASYRLVGDFWASLPSAAHKIVPNKYLVGCKKSYGGDVYHVKVKKQPAGDLPAWRVEDGHSTRKPSTFHFADC